MWELFNRDRMPAIVPDLLPVTSFRAYHAAMAGRYESRCHRRWILDLSLVQWAGPLVVDSTAGWVLAEDSSLSRLDPRTGFTAWTAILGVPYSVRGRDMPAINPGEGYDGLLPEQGDFGFVRSMDNGAASTVPDAVGKDDGEGPASTVTFRVVEVEDAEQAGRRVAELMGRPFNSSADLVDTPAPPARLPSRHSRFRAMLGRLLG